MANIDLSQYGITGTTEVVYNPSYEMLFEEETKETLEVQKGYIEEAMKLRGDKQMIPSNVSTLYDETAASITSTWKEVVSQIVLGSTSVEDGLKSYKNFWDSVDGDTMLKELNGQ